MDRVKVATVWLGGCSGCHMSFLDMDEFLIDLAEKIQVVYSPIADMKEFPESVDVTLVEGSVANEDHIELCHKIRAASRVVISFGDCAVTGNVPAMRNPLGDPEKILQLVYVDRADTHPIAPKEAGIVPKLVDRVRPVHEEIDVDYFIPGCPPSSSRIKEALTNLLEMGETHLTGENLRFG